MKYNLEPCPFCGEHESLDIFKWRSGDHAVRCCTCGTFGPSQMEERDHPPVSEEEAIELWNRRHKGEA